MEFTLALRRFSFHRGPLSMADTGKRLLPAFESHPISETSLDCTRSGADVYGRSRTSSRRPFAPYLDKRSMDRGFAHCNRAVHNKSWRTLGSTNCTSRNRTSACLLVVSV